MNNPLQLTQRISMFQTLGQRLLSLSDDELDALAEAAGAQNNWFTPKSVKKAMTSIASMLSEEALEEWTSPYHLEPDRTKNIGVVMAGNIPLVGFHDLLSVLISGHNAKIKLSSQDSVLPKFIIDLLIEIQPKVKSRIELVERLNNMDAVIATGSDNSARYFKHYFAKAPHIIRQNRTSVALIDGHESNYELVKLGEDIFEYYGLGCRNISKVYIPLDYDVTCLLDALMTFEHTLDHHKYRNNYDYNKSIYLVNREEHFDTGFLLLKESDETVSPISVLYFERYRSLAELDLKLSANRDKIQAITSRNGWYEGSIDFGTAQCPSLWDYADGVDTLEFLDGLN